MRILVANTPLMYRETLALAILRHNATFEVMIADPASLDGEAERFAPNALVRDDDGIEVSAPDGVVCWVGITHRQPPQGAHQRRRAGLGDSRSEHRRDARRPR